MQQVRGECKTLSMGPYQKTNQSRIMRSAVVNRASISLRVAEGLSLQESGQEHVRGAALVREP